MSSVQTRVSQQTLGEMGWNLSHATGAVTRASPQMSHKSKQRLSGFFSPLVFNNELIIYVLTFNPFFQGRGGKWEYITAVIRSGLGKTTIHTVIYVRIHTSGQFRVNILFLDCWESPSINTKNQSSDFQNKETSKNNYSTVCPPSSFPIVNVPVCNLYVQTIIR